MQAPTWTEFLQCSVCTNRYDLDSVVPVSLTCGHTICKRCLAKLKTRACPYDKTPISSSLAETLPPNTALLSLLGHVAEESTLVLPEAILPASDAERYRAARQAVEDLAQFLQPLVDQESPQTASGAVDTAASSTPALTKPMQKKLAVVVNCQLLEAEGRSKALRAARSIADRTITELLVLHQNQQQISTLLWTAIRNRGCQFLGPVMQQDTLRFILKVMETGQFLSRKTIVLYVLQQLLNDYPQASKTSVGHVVQLLYRASCFNVEKRDEDSSLMQLKEEYRTYSSLRREHDVQIVKIAMESGLRISPEQWSSLLHGNHDHKSEMQSVIDKLVTQGVASCGLNELIVAISRAQDPYSLSERIIPPLEVLLKLDMNSDQTSTTATSWLVFVEAMKALVSTLQCFSECMQRQNGRYKTGMCPNLLKLGECPRGTKCTYAHSEEEKELYRSLSTKSKSKPRSGEVLQSPKPTVVPASVVTGSISGDLPSNGSPYSSLGSVQGPGGTTGPAALDYSALQSPALPLDHPVIVQRAPAFNPVVADSYGRHQGTYVPRAVPGMIMYGGLQEELRPHGGPGASYLGQYGHIYQSSYPQHLHDSPPTSLMAGGREGQFDYQSEMEATRLKRDETAQYFYMGVGDGGTYIHPGGGGIGSAHSGVGSGTYAHSGVGSGTYAHSGVGSGTYAHSGVGSGTYAHSGVGSGTYAHPDPSHREHHIGDNPGHILDGYPHARVWAPESNASGLSLSSDSSSGMTGPQYFSNGESPYSSGQFHRDIPQSQHNLLGSTHKMEAQQKVDNDMPLSASAASQAVPSTTPTLSLTHLNTAATTTTVPASASNPNSEQSSLIRSGPSSGGSHGSSYGSGSSVTQGSFVGSALPSNIEELQERVRALELKLREREGANQDHAHPVDTRYPSDRDAPFKHPPPPLPSFPVSYPEMTHSSHQRVKSPYASPPYSSFGGPVGGVYSQPHPYGPQPAFQPQPQSQWREVCYPSLGRAPPTGVHRRTSPQNTFLQQQSAPFVPSVPFVQDPYQEQSDQMLAAYLQHMEQQKAIDAQRAAYGRHGAQPTYVTEQMYSSYPRRPL